MLFNSLDFLLFFPIVTGLFFLLPHRFRWFHLLLSSCIFYAAFIPVYILILFITIIIDYIAGIMIENAAGGKRKKYLILSLVANIGVLAVFKYYNFFIDNMNLFLESISITTYSFPLMGILLPIGLSFHTFQAMSYTVEVYRGNEKAERHFGIYSLYVMFFPQLVAGPIERPQNVLHQFHERKYFDSQNLIDGLRLMLWGFFKKLVIADRIALYVNAVYNDAGSYHYLNLIIATILFSIQIYCDFSGYSDIAIGAAKTMGYDLMINFRRPYFATNIQAFWSRWHISLSTWFRDYLYIPMGGNRVSTARKFVNTATVFLVSGLWHGANWTFIFWGALHALFVAVFIFFNKKMSFLKIDNFFGSLLGWAITFCLVAFAWIFFRANSLQDAFLICNRIFHLYSIHEFQTVVQDSSNLLEFGLTSTTVSIVMIALMLMVEKYLSPVLLEMNKRPFFDVCFFSFFLTLIITFGVFHNSSFIYFQF
jgi:alginate O-acetyltransferase complex protein AlgI